MLGTVHEPTKIDDPLRFLEPKRPMRCMSHDVLDWRIGRELVATVGRRPALHLSDERACHAFTPRGWLNLQALQKSDRGGACAVDIVDSLRSLNEAYRGAVRSGSKANAMTAQQGISHVAQVLGFSSVGS